MPSSQVCQWWLEVAAFDGYDDEVGLRVSVAMRAWEETADAIEGEVIAALPRGAISGGVGESCGTDRAV